MARLTREESRAQTRERLLQKAIEHFLEKGYNAASIEQIAEEADFSKGAVYSNFASKDELAMHVVSRVRAERLGGLLEMMPEGGTAEEALDVFREWADKVIGDRAWTMLEIEFAARARQREDLFADIGEGIEQAQKFASMAVAALAERYGIALTDTPANLAARLLSVGIGLGVQRAFHPATSLEPLMSAIADVIGAESRDG